MPDIITENGFDPIVLHNDFTPWSTIKDRVGTPQKFHYMFSHWSLTENGPKLSDSYIFKKDTLLHAVYEKIPIVITIDFEEEGGTQLLPFRTRSDLTFAVLKVLFVQPYKEGYTFSHWSLTKGGSVIPDNYIFEVSTTIWAVYNVGEAKLRSKKTFKLTIQELDAENTIEINEVKWKDIKDKIKESNSDNFSHWSLTKHGEQISDNYKFRKDTKLFAVYKI